MQGSIVIRIRGVSAAHAPMHPFQESLLLAISPASRGFGYVFMKGPAGLIDWGVKDIRQDKNVTCLEKLDALITFYGPEFVVFENPSETPSRRSLRIRHLLQGVERLADRKGVKGNPIGRRDMRDFFSRHGAGTKHRRAEILASQFPELASSLPPPRKIWMSEDPRISIFESLALALAFWYADKPPSSIERPLSGPSGP
ncbi:MAG: hypothetical protein M3461_11775 [Pseudomonadota bacterium]|nr:hypothetical protein [Pseudomonadota bacterium]